MKVACVGDCGIDHYLPGNDRYFGGITANFARHARDQFADNDLVQIVSCIGNDDGGELVLGALDNAGIDCHISRVDGMTPVQFIEIEANGEKRFVRYEEGVLRDFRFDSMQKGIIAEADLLVAPVYLQIVGLLDELLSLPTGGLTSIDFADFLEHPDFELLDRHLERIDIAFFGLRRDNVAEIESIRSRASSHGGMFVVTLGPDGSLVFSGDTEIGCPAVPVDEVVDTTGAGDAYAAGFLSRYCHGGSVEDAMAHGAKVAAAVIGQMGSYSSV